MSTPRQTSFAAGELSPRLWGRSDLELYAQGLRRCRDFVINKQGSLESRPGTRRCWQAKVDDVVLVPFLHASRESYVLEFGHLYVRIYNARTLALSTELVTPFQSTDLHEMQWAQFGSSLIVTHRSRVPQEIRIESAATIIPVRFTPPGETYGAAALHAVFPSIGGNPPADPVLVAWQPGTLFVVDAAHPPREWKYKVSTIVQHVLTGELVETLARDITHYVSGDVSTGTVPVAPGSEVPLPSDNQLILFDDAPIYIEPGLGTTRTASSNWVPVENLYYRGRGALFGLVGRCAPNARFADFGDEPDYATPPLRGEQPYPAGDYPAAVSFFAQRRFFGGTSTRPSTWWASAVDEFENGDAPVVPYAGCPLEATLVDARRESIVAMLSGAHQYVFTDTAVWSIGQRDLAFDFDTFASTIRIASRVGAASLAPLDVDGVVLYVRAQGRGVRSLAPNGDGFSGADVEAQAEHFFRGLSTRIHSWCLQRMPWNVAWAVREDGVLLSLSRGLGGAWGWARHDVGGVVRSVASVPESDTSAARGDSDLLFLAVERTGGTFIERITPNVTVDPPLYATDPDYAGNPIGAEQPTYPVDAHVVATVTKATGTTITGLGHLEGEEVWASCPGLPPDGPFTVTGGAVTTTAGWGPTGATTFRAAVGLAVLPELETLDAPPRLNQKTLVSVGFELDSAEGVMVGEDFDHLVPGLPRNVTDSYEFPSAASLLAKVKVNGSWRVTGRAVLRQTKPLAVTVLGVTRELEQGGSR